MLNSTKVYNQFCFVDDITQGEIEVYLTALDGYIDNQLKICADSMLVVFYHSSIPLNGTNFEAENIEKNRLRDSFLRFSKSFTNIIVIDPASGYSVNFFLYKLISQLKYWLWRWFKLAHCEPIDIPRVCSKLENKCYSYNDLCQGHHYQWESAVYPCLILLRNKDFMNSEFVI